VVTTPGYNEMYRELYHKAKRKKIADYYYNPMAVAEVHAKYTSPFTSISGNQHYRAKSNFTSKVSL
jgi:hypothetical protein